MRIAHWKIAGCLCLSMCMASCSAPQASLPAAGLAQEDQLGRSLAATVADPVHGMASLAVLAVRDGRVAYRQGWGSRYIHPSDPALNRPAGPDTLYRIASVSKFVTTLGVMRLVEQGKLSLDRDVSDYLGFRLRNPAFPEQPVSLRMLLSHTSSLRDEGGYSWGATLPLEKALRENQRAWDGKHRPGSYFAYSNLNWGVIGTVMEAATGERFDRLMQRLVLSPLEMDGSYNVATLAPDARSRLATLYRKKGPGSSAGNPAGPWVAQIDDDSGRQAAAPPGLDNYAIGSNGTLFSPTGGLRASADDLGKIMLMLLDEGRHGGRSFLAPASLKEIFSAQWRYDPALRNGDTHHGLFSHWGLGVQHFDATPGAATPGAGSSLVPGGYAAWGHLGEAYGLLSVFAVNFQERSGMVVLIGGTASDPAATPGSYSALSRQEELVLSALHEHVLRASPRQETYKK